jgi:hypothetical protein
LPPEAGKTAFGGGFLTAEPQNSKCKRSGRAYNPSGVFNSKTAKCKIENVKVKKALRPPDA